MTGLNGYLPIFHVQFPQHDGIKSAFTVMLGKRFTALPSCWGRITVMLGKKTRFFTVMLGKNYRHVEEKKALFHAQFAVGKRYGKDALFRKDLEKEFYFVKIRPLADKTMPKTKTTAPTLLASDPHSGRDEMNLAGHPFALLQSPKRQSSTSIYYEWERTINGRTVTASWRVETPEAYGLPGPEEELLYLVLLQLTREAAEAAGTPGQWPRTVYFSRSDVLRRLGWGDSVKRYEALALAFARLKSVSIKAQHAFYDADAKAPAADALLGILGEAVIHAEPPGRKSQGVIPLSYFEWSKSLHKSFLAGNMRSLALDFAISLDHPTSRRLFRLLEVLRNATKPPLVQLRIGLDKLRDRMGMTAYKYPSKIAEKLAPAVKELVERGYIVGMDMERGANGAHLAVFRFYNVTTAPHPALPAAPPPEPSEPPQSPSTGAPNLRAIEIPSFAALLPDFGTPSRADSDDVAAQLDAFFEALPQTEKDEIESRAHAAMPPFLQDNPRTSGALTEMQRGRRRELLARYPKLKRATSD